MNWQQSVSALMMNNIKWISLMMDLVRGKLINYINNKNDIKRTIDL